MSPDAPQEIPPSAAPPASDAEGRLRECSDLLALLADELEALERHDPARQRELAGLRAKLEAELRGADEAGIPLHLWIADRVDEALRHIEAWTEHDRRSRDQLARLQEGSLPLVRGIGSFPVGRYHGAGPGDARLDVRF